MMTRDSAKNARPATLSDGFTTAELERLAVLRRDFNEHVEHSEFMLDPTQLEFARWLYENGRISEHPTKATKAKSRE